MSFYVTKTNANRARDKDDGINVTKSTPHSRTEKDVGSTPVLEEIILIRELKSQKRAVIRKIRNIIGDEPLTESKIA